MKDKSQQIVNDIQLALAGQSPMVNATMRAGCRKLLEKCTDMVDRLLHEYKTALIEELGNPFMYDGDKAIVYPEGTKFFNCYQDATTVLVVEDKPRMRTVLFDGASSQDSDRDCYQLAFPYVIYIIWFTKAGEGFHFAGLNVGYRNEPLTDIMDEVYEPNLPNITHHQVCLDWNKHGPNLAKLCEECITHFWESSFNSDGNEGWVRMSKHDSRLRTLLSWERASLEDPLFVLNVDWQVGDMRLRDIMQEETMPPVGEVNDFLQRLISKTLATCISRLPLSEVEKTLSTALRDTVAIAVKEAILKSVK